MQFYSHFLLLLLLLAVVAAPFHVHAAPLSEPFGNRNVTRWIIQLMPQVDGAAIAFHQNKVHQIHARNLARRGEDGNTTTGIKFKYDFGDFKGYSGSFDVDTVEELRAMPEVMRIEPDAKLYPSTQVVHVTQQPAPWGLGGLSSTKPSSQYYRYDSSAGKGTYSYVLDSGIRITHAEFEGRAIWGHNSVNDIDTDVDGHGTFVAGIIGGKNFGVAKKTTLVAVKVLTEGSSESSAILSGLLWAAEDIKKKGRENLAVINISLAGPADTISEAVVREVWKQGVLQVVATGNSGQDGTKLWPGSCPETVNVGALDPNDNRCTFSNFGPAVDIWAPGWEVQSSWFASDLATTTQSGTSAAAPHVAGLVSYLRGLRGPMSASAVRRKLLQLAIPGRVVDARGAADLVAYNGIDHLWHGRSDEGNSSVFENGI